MLRMHRSYNPSATGRNVVCTKYCTTYRRTLSGCTRCPMEIKNYQPPVINRVRLPSPPQKPQSAIVPQAQSETFGALAPQAQLMKEVVNVATSPRPRMTTTPDWNKLCSQLCRNGQGGVFCNCDLPPF